MTTSTQQPEALLMAKALREGALSPNVLQNEIAVRDRSAAELLRQHAEIARLTAENEALRAQIKANLIGLQISVDVSTGDHDAGHRLFGTVTGTLDTMPLTLLCDDAKPNFRPGPQVAWRPMETAPKDGTLVRLLVNFECHATNDWPSPCPTIGSNTWDNDGSGEWQFAGWNWEHDCYTQGIGTPIGWMPLLTSEPASYAEQPRHSDDDAVDAFADAMKAKMARQRARGYSGWRDCPAEKLRQMLIDHIAKGDPVDVGNFAMMLFNRWESTKP